jgi:hypothetical protein
MKRIVLLLLVCAAVTLIAVAPTMLGQDESIGRKLYFLVKPLVGGGDLDLIQKQSDAGAGLKLWTYHITSTRSGSKGQKFTGVMVGNSPLTTNGTTTTTMQIVPVIIKIGSDTFDPTKASPCASGKVPLTLMQQSPMVLPASFKMNGVNVGKEQYSDAFERANFWKEVQKNGGSYHNKLKVVTLKPITINPGTTYSAILFNESCGPFGGVELNWWDNLVTTKIIPSLKSQGVDPTTFPIFMFYNVAWFVGKTSECCVGGYHGAFGNPAQTYSPFLFDLTGVFGVGTEDTDIAAHEVDEWQDDPLGTNATPAWGHVGQVTGCQSNLEVGDPLTGTNFPNVTMPNGYTYHLQELAFFSWFYGPPSIGAGHKFSDNGTFTSAQGACTN